MKNILVTIEINEDADILISKASELAKYCNAKLWIVHIAQPDPDFAGYEVGPKYIRDFRASELREEHKILGEKEKELNKQGIETTALLIQGATTMTILEECRKLDVDMVVIGHHKSSILYRAFFGSIDSQLIDKSEIPVLVVPV